MGLVQESKDELHRRATATVTAFAGVNFICSPLHTESNKKLSFLGTMQNFEETETSRNLLSEDSAKIEAADILSHQTVP